MIRGMDMCATQYPLIRFEKIINGGKNRHTTNKYVAIHGQTYNKEQHTFRVYIDQVGSPPEEKKIRYLIKSIAAQQRGNINKSKERQSSRRRPSDFLPYHLRRHCRQQAQLSRRLALTSVSIDPPICCLEMSSSLNNASEVDGGGGGGGGGGDCICSS
jgi:hypothetical protein